MFRNKKEMSKKYFPILNRVFRFDKTTKIQSVDFNKPWWTPILNNKIRLTIFALAEIAVNIFDALLPILLTLLLVSRQFQNIIYFALVWFSLQIFSHLSFYLLCQVESEIVHSVQYQANRFFLTVDPIYHSTRSSGQIITKINRGSESYEAFLDLVSRDILGVVVGIVTVVITLFQFNTSLAVLALGSLIIISVFSILAKVFITGVTISRTIADEDSAKATNIETLREVNLIRSSFATKEQDNKLETKNHKYMATMATMWYSHITVGSIVRYLYMISVLILTYQIFNLINTNQIALEIAISLLLSYLSGTSSLLKIGRYVEKVLDRSTRINDLFVFIREFGKQTYPVLPDSKSEKLNFNNNV